MRIQRIGNRAALRRRGTALIASLVVVLVVASMGAALIQMHASITRRTAHAIDTKRALYIAEAGLSEAFLAVAQGRSGNVASVDEPAIFGDGIYWVEATNESDGRVTLDANGLCGAGRFSLSMVLQRQVNDLGTLGIFAEDGVTIKKGAIIDGYDSVDGDFDAAVVESRDGGMALPAPTAEESTGGGARVGSNGDIVLEGDPRAPVGGEVTKVYGNVFPGPAGTATVEPGALVSGTTTPSLMGFSLPPFELPTDLVSAGDLRLADPSKDTTVTYEKLRYDEFIVASGTSLVIEGPATIVTEQFIVEDGSKLFLDTTGGGISIYVTDYLEWQANSTVYSPSEDAAGVSLLIDDCPVIDRTGNGRVDQPIQFNGRGNLHGMIYAPYNKVTVPGSLRVFGSVISKELVVGQNARITFDESVTRGAVATASLPKLLSWRLVDLPDVPLVKIGLDPRTTLRMNGVTPVKSEVASAERDVRFEYLDKTGVVKTYNGPADTFDWTDLDSLIDADWIDPGTLLPIASDTDKTIVPNVESMPPIAIKSL